MGINMKMQKGLEADEQAMKQDIERGKQEQETKERRQKVIDLYNSGMSQVAMAREFGVDKSTITRDLDYIRKNHPGKLIEREARPDPARDTTRQATTDIIQKPEATTQEHLPNTPQAQQKPQETTASPETPAEKKIENKANTKPLKQSFSFRADIDKIEDWKLYAETVGAKDIGTLWTAALDEFMSNHPLTADQKQIFAKRKEAAEMQRNFSGL